MRPVKFPVQVRSHIPYSVCYIIYVTCSRDALYQCLLAIKYVFLQWMTLTIDIRLYINHGLQITSPSTCTASQPKHRHMLSFYFILSSSWERSNVQQSLISILERNSTIFQIFGLSSEGHYRPLDECNCIMVRIGRQEDEARAMEVLVQTRVLIQDEVRRRRQKR